MATKENDLPEGKMTICGRCKEKFTAFWKDMAEEWSNNFKMCYCPWESKTYDVDSDQITSDQSQLQWQKEQEMANVAQGDTEIQMTPTMEQLEALKIEPTIYSTLGYYLNIEPEKLNEIARNTTNTKDCLREVYRVWLEKGLDITWETLAQALESMHLNDKASEVRREYIPGNQDQ